MTKQRLLDRLAPHGQEHVLAFWEELSSAEQATLTAQIEALDFAQLDSLVRKGSSTNDWGALAARAVGPPAIRLDGRDNAWPAAEAEQAGRAALARGEVGVVLVAGGQGTRLGFEHPKGMFPIGPVSGASLFRIHFEKIRAAADRSGCSIPLYVMTSDATDDETRSYLAEHKQFGMPESDVIVFRQGAMPAVDAASGKLLLSEPGSLCLSPDGHGGMLAAMHRGGVLRDAARRGLRQLFYFQVDNALAPVCDAAMLGYHLLARSELTTLVVAKRDAAQRVGNVVSIDGVVQIIEYSDLPDEAAQRRTSDGELQLWAGNIAVHIFDVELMQRAAADAESLPFHIAEKKVPHLDAAGRRVAPSKPNALKFERFIFDLLPAAKNALVVEGDPGEIFAPLKNAPGEASDTEAHVQHRMAALHRQWLTAAGVAVAPETPVEISPLFALDAEELARKVDGQLRIDAPTYLET